MSRLFTPPRGQGVWTNAREVEVVLFKTCSCWWSPPSLLLLVYIILNDITQFFIYLRRTKYAWSHFRLSLTCLHGKGAIALIMVVKQVREVFFLCCLISFSFPESSAPHTMEATFERLDMVIYSVSPLQFLSLKENLIATSEGAYSN